MKTPLTSFRLPEEFLRKMDKLLKRPTKGLMDPMKGVPRNRTELLVRLVERELGEQDKEKDKGSG